MMEVKEVRQCSSEGEAVAWQHVCEQVSELLIIHFGLMDKQVTFATRLDEDLALDSLDLVEFGMVLRDQFQVDLSIEMLRLPYTVGDMASLVAAALAESQEKG